jgi:hypothetical protein
MIFVGPQGCELFGWVACATCRVDPESRNLTSSAGGLVGLPVIAPPNWDQLDPNIELSWRALDVLRTQACQYRIVPNPSAENHHVPSVCGWIPAHDCSIDVNTGFLHSCAVREMCHDKVTCSLVAEPIIIPQGPLHLDTKRKSVLTSLRQVDPGAFLDACATIAESQYDCW